MVLHNMYGHVPRRALASIVNDLGDALTTVNCALLANTYVPDLDTHQTFADVSAHEVSGTAYTAGGTEVTTKSLTHAAGTTTFDGADAVWADSTITAAYAVVYEAGSGTLLTLVNFEGDQSSDNGEFRVQWAAGGIATITT